MKKLFCAWWNLENLFDVENAPGRSDKLNRAIGKDLVGWNEQILGKKIDQLASVINQMNNGQGPDILGVAEVENRNVLEMLVKKLGVRKYDIAHVESPDERGIDVAFVFDGQIMESKETFNHVVMRRTATRDILQVNFNLKEMNQPIVFIANHWPSRTAGGYESEPYRMIAGETLAYFHERIYDMLGDKTPVIAMGDFNDNPFNRSLIEYALAVNSKEKIANAREIKYFYNLMWPRLALGEGSYYYNGFDLLDQFLVSGNVIDNKSYVTADEASCHIVKFPGMDKNGKPVRFGKPKDKGGVNEKGYSDHFPIAFELNVP